MAVRRGGRGRRRGGRGRRGAGEGTGELEGSEQGEFDGDGEDVVEMDAAPAAAVETEVEVVEAKTDTAEKKEPEARAVDAMTIAVTIAGTTGANLAQRTEANLGIIEARIGTKVEVTTADVTDRDGAMVATAARSRRSLSFFAKARKSLSRSRRNRSRKKARESHRTSRSRDDSSFTCRRSNISACRERSNRQMSADVCEL